MYVIIINKINLKNIIIHFICIFINEIISYLFVTSYKFL